MAVLTDSAVQETLEAAEAVLWGTLEGRSMDENPRLWVAFSLLRSVRIYSKSSNGIPGYRGLGLDEAVSFAEAILEHKPSSDREIAIHSYKLEISVATK